MQTKMKLSAAWILAVALMLPACAPAQDAVSNQSVYQKAVAAVQKHDFQAALKLLKPLAEKGDATAQNNLAVLYQDALGNGKEALRWYEKAGAQGLADAQFMAGYLYSSGSAGIKQNYEKAVYWYRKAAEQGDSEAQTNLAARYATGTGVKQDLQQAKEWFGKAAAQGNKQAAGYLKQLDEMLSRQQKRKK